MAITPIASLTKGKCVNRCVCVTNLTKGKKKQIKDAHI